MRRGIQALVTAQDREKQFMDALRDDAPHVDLPIALETSFFRLNDKDVFVPITAKLPSSVLDWAEKRNRHRATFDFAAEVHDATTNKIVAALRDQIMVTLDSDRYSQLQKQSLEYQGGVVLGPGSYKLKFLARENESGRIGSFEEDLNLPNPQPERLSSAPCSYPASSRPSRQLAKSRKKLWARGKTEILTAGIFRPENRTQRHSCLQHEAGVVRFFPGVYPRKHG